MQEVLPVEGWYVPAAHSATMASSASGHCARAVLSVRLLASVGAAGVGGLRTGA